MIDWDAYADEMTKISGGKWTGFKAGLSSGFTSPLRSAKAALTTGPESRRVAEEFGEILGPKAKKEFLQGALGARMGMAVGPTAYAAGGAAGAHRYLKKKKEQGGATKHW